jgi:transposase-like protein
MRTNSQPEVPGIDWGPEIEHFQTQFQNKEDCAEYLYAIKWPNGFICPCCNRKKAYVIRTRRLPLFECAHCRYQASLLSNTIMEGSRTSLFKWFLAIYLVSRSKSINAVQLAEIIQVTYKTSWLILHKIRHAIGKEDARHALSGDVMVNGALYSKRILGSIFKHPKEVPILIGASMSTDNKPTYLKMQALPKLEERFSFPKIVLHEFAKNHTDEHHSNLQFITKGFTPLRHKPLLPLFHAAHQWISQTFRGIGPKHLQAYLNEYCYRFNAVAKEIPVFTSLLQLCSSTKPIPYRILTLPIYRTTVQKLIA